MRVLQPNAAAVAAKVIDGEAIIMNLLNGAYYSMDQAGAVVWEMIEQVRSAEEIEQALATRYAIDASTARADVSRLLAELLAEQLIIETEQNHRAPSAAGMISEPGAYQPPVLNKYTEMADLLALDPPMPAIGELPAEPDRA